MIKAIQTRYAGYLFRSRLEARWAVFFDALKLDWTYEPEGFELKSGTRYLPDFRIALPNGILWVEVKPDGVRSKEFEEFILTCNQQNWRGTVLHEIPDPRKYYDGHDVLFSGSGDSDYVFCSCLMCHQVGFEFNGHSVRMQCCALPGRNDASRITAAFATARAARFEHDQREKYTTV